MNSNSNLNNAFQERFKGKTSLMPREGVDGVIKDSDNPIPKSLMQKPQYLVMDGLTAHQRYFNQKREAHTFDQNRPFVSPENQTNPINSVYYSMHNKTNRSFDGILNNNNNNNQNNHKQPLLTFKYFGKYYFSLQSSLKKSLQNQGQFQVEPRFQHQNGNQLLARNDMDSIDKQINEMTFMKISQQHQKAQSQTLIPGTKQSQIRDSGSQRVLTHSNLNSPTQLTTSQKHLPRQLAFSANKALQNQAVPLRIFSKVNNQGSKSNITVTDIGNNKNVSSQQLDIMRLFSRNNSQGDILKNKSNNIIDQSSPSTYLKQTQNGTQNQQWDQKLAQIKSQKQLIPQTRSNDMISQSSQFSMPIKRHLMPLTNATVLESDLEETNNQAYFQDQQNINIQDLSTQHVNYKPYTLSEYKDMQLKIPQRLGGLGPNVGNEQWQMKKEMQAKRQEFAKQVQQINTQLIQYQQDQGQIAVSKQKQEISSREKALEFAKHIPKPTLNSLSQDQQTFNPSSAQQK